MDLKYFVYYKRLVSLHHMNFLQRFVILHRLHIQQLLVLHMYPILMLVQIVDKHEHFLQQFLIILMMIHNFLILDFFFIFWNKFICFFCVMWCWCYDYQTFISFWKFFTLNCFITIITTLISWIINFFTNWKTFSFDWII